MSDTNLEKLIADSIAKRSAQEADQLAAAAREESQYQDLLTKAIDKRLAQLTSEIPPALQPYCEATDTPSGDRGQQIKKLGEGWLPDCFRINAPGLATIFFRVGKEWDEKAQNWGKPQINSLATSGQYCDDHRRWFLAIAEAARLHVEHAEFNARQAERDREQDERQRMLAQKRAEASREPSTFERIESLIREIVREEISATEVEGF